MCSAAEFPTAQPPPPMHHEKKPPFQSRTSFSDFQLAFDAPRKAHSIEYPTYIVWLFNCHSTSTPGRVLPFSSLTLPYEKWSSTKNGTTISGVKLKKINQGSGASCAVRGSPLSTRSRMAISPLALRSPSSRDTIQSPTFGRILSREEKTKERDLSKFSGMLRNRQRTGVSPPSTYPICFNTAAN